MHLIYIVAAEHQRSDKESSMESLWLQEESRRKGGVRIQPPAVESRTLLYEGQRSVIEVLKDAPPSSTIIVSSWDVCKSHTKRLKVALEERRHSQVVLVCLRPYLKLDPKTEETAVALYLLQQSMEASRSQRAEEVREAFEKDRDDRLHRTVVRHYMKSLKTIPEIAAECEIPETRVRRILSREVKPSQRKQVEDRRRERDAKRQAESSRSYSLGAIPTQARFEYSMLDTLGLPKDSRLFLLILEHAKSRQTDRTRQVSYLTWKEFFNFMAEMEPSVKFSDPSDIREEHLQKWAQELFARVKRSTAATKFYTIKSFYTWLMNTGEATRTPFAAFKIPRHERAAVKADPLSKDEIRALKTVIADKVKRTKGGRDHWRALRLQAIMRLFLWTGARSSSLLSMRLSDVNLQSDHVRLKMILKGGSQHEMMLPQKARDELDEYIKAVHHGSAPDAFLFYAGVDRRHHPLRYDSLWVELADAGHEAKIKGLSSHSFRSTFATQSDEDGVPEEQIQKALGLKTRDQLRFYVKKKQRLVMPSWMLEDVS